MLRLFKKKWPVVKVNTAQVNGKLVILDGLNPIRYVDLATNKLVVYRPKRKRQ